MPHSTPYHQLPTSSLLNPVLPASARQINTPNFQQTLAHHRGTPNLHNNQNHNLNLTQTTTTTPHNNTTTMPPTKTSKGKSRLSATTPQTSKTTTPTLPFPFKPAPAALQPFTTPLPKSHIYITHIDPRPAPFKRNIFLVPVTLNLLLTLLIIWRIWYITPYYLALISSALFGNVNETTLRAADLSYRELVQVVLRRAGTFAFDFGLGVFLGPWPWEFVFGERLGRGTPVMWRWKVGFREKEVYVRRSRESWDGDLGRVDLFAPEGDEVARLGREEVLKRVREATAPVLMHVKTGYATMDGYWDLDWRGMVEATGLVDRGEVEIEAFESVVLLHHERFGWVTVELGGQGGGGGDERQRQLQLLAFKDALAAMDKEDLFFRWVEMMQAESRQGEFTIERQVVAARKVRDLFKSNDVDFDALWRETVGTDGIPGMPGME